MELQLALDRIEKKRAIDIVESLKDLRQYRTEK